MSIITIQRIKLGFYTRRYLHVYKRIFIMMCLSLCIETMVHNSIQHTHRQKYARILAARSLFSLCRYMVCQRANVRLRVQWSGVGLCNMPCVVVDVRSRRSGQSGERHACTHWRTHFGATREYDGNRKVSFILETGNGIFIFPVINGNPGLNLAFIFCGSGVHQGEHRTLSTTLLRPRDYGSAFSVWF